MNEEASPSPNVNRSIYGYVLFLSTNLIAMLYFVCAFVPDEVLTNLGILYYPSKYWCLAIPLYLIVSVAVFALFIYPGINCILTKPLNSECNVTDKFSKQSLDGYKNSFGEISPIYDLSIDEVCGRVYLDEQFLKDVKR